MSSSIKITLYRTASDAPTTMTAAEFREFVSGSEEFFSANILQTGIPGVVSDTSVYIKQNMVGDYVCYIMGTGFNAQSTVPRASLLSNLRFGYGLWAL